MTAFTITSASAFDLAAMDAAYEAADRAFRHRVPAARLDAYRDFLADAPGPKSGRGNPWLFTAALKAKSAGIPAELAQADISAAMSHKPHGEVVRAVRRAYQLTNDFTFNPAPRIPKHEKAVADPYWAECGRKYPEGMDPMEMLWESSPIRIDWDPSEDAARLLGALYAPGEYVYVGGAREAGVIGRNIRTAADWLTHIKSGGKLGQFWMMNPLTGRPAPKASEDGYTLRGDGCIASHRFVLCEFDHISHAAQAGFWLNSKLPVAAVVDSGGESLHGWLRVDCADAATWIREIKEDLYPRILEPLGADRQCKNPSRLSRCPGVMRGENWQKLLYLNPEAGR